MNLADINPGDIKVVETPNAATPAPIPSGNIDLSAINPSDVFELPTSEAEEKFGGPTGMGAAFTGHVVNTNIPGATRIAGQDPETTKGLTEANPISSMAGDVLGFLGGVGSGVGVPSIISNLGKKASALAPGFMGKALGFGAEGALMGASSSANDLALGDPNLTAQKALTNMGFGAALGIGGAALAQTAESVLPQATKKLSKALGGLQESVMGTAENPSIVAKAMAVPGAVLKGESHQASLDALFKGLDAGETTVPKVVQNLDSVLEHSGTVVDDLNKTIQEEAGLTKGPIKNFGASPGEPLFAPKDPEQIEANLKLKSLLTSHLINENEVQRLFMNESKTAVDPKKLETLFTNFNSNTPEIAAQKEALNNFLSSSKEVLNASQNYANYKSAESSISKMVNNLASQSKTNESILKAIAPDTFMKRFSKEAMAGAALHMMGVPSSAIKTGIAALEMYKMASNPYEMGSTLYSGFQKLKVLSEINEKVGEKIASGAKSIFSNPAVRNQALPHSAPMALPAMADQKGYEKKVVRIGELASNPQMLQNHLAMHTEDLYQDAPNVSAGIHQGILSGVGFLGSKIPKASSQMLLSEKWQPSHAQKQTFMNYYRAVNDPVSALKDIKNGTLTNQTMEALQATKPHLLQEMRSKVMEHLNPQKAMKLPFSVKASLSKFMGEPLSEGLLPSVIMGNQMSFIGPQQSQQGAVRQRQTASGNMKELSLANRSETETQSHEKEED